MNEKEKQIEEMAEVLDAARINALATIGSLNDGFGMWYARAMYNAGYRRQSGATDENVGRKCEWISVEERLPEKHGQYLAAFTNMKVDVVTYTKIGWFYDKRCSITHWMPLTAPPNP